MHPVILAFGGLDFRSAQVLAGLSALAAYLYMSLHRPRGLSADDFWNIMLVLSISVIGGGIILYLLAGGGGLAANLRFYFAKRRIPGGAFYGSLCASVGAVFAYCRARKLEFLPVADILGPASMLALCIMRLGCFMNGCCHGSPTDLPWGVVFRDARCGVPDAWLGIALHPTQLYESVGALAVFFFAHFFVLQGVRGGRLRSGAAFVASVGLYAAFRFVSDFTRGNESRFPHGFGLGVGQWMSLGILAVLALILWKCRRQARAVCGPVIGL